MRRFAWLAVLACLGAGACSQRDVAVLDGATLVDGTGRPPVTDSVVVVRGERIAAAGPRGAVRVPPGAAVVDLSGKWLVPGLVDAHVHFFQSGGLYTRPDVVDLREIRPYPEEIAGIRARIDRTLARYLASGVTAVLDAGGPLWTFEVRERARALGPAPRVAATGPLLGTRVPAVLGALDDPPMLAIDTPAAARAAVEGLARHRPDLVKIWWVRPDADLADQLARVRAAVEAAHARGLPVLAHATQRRVARAAVKAGADRLAHGVRDEPVDEGLLDAVARRGVVYTPTLAVGEGYREVLGRRVELLPIERRLGDPEALASFGDVERLPPRLFPPRPPRSRPAGPRRVEAENLRRVAARGITVAAGSDAGNIGTLHGPSLHRELELMAAAGLTPMQVLVAATAGGAAALGRAGDLGTVEPGKLADLVVLDADPLQDIRHTQAIARVMRGGRWFDPAAIAAWLAQGTASAGERPLPPPSSLSARPPGAARTTVVGYPAVRPADLEPPADRRDAGDLASLGRDLPRLARHAPRVGRPALGTGPPHRQVQADPAPPQRSSASAGPPPPGRPWPSSTKPAFSPSR